MADRVLLVNGLPASGKSTLASALGSSLALPVLAKDRFKETLADSLDTPLTGTELRRAAMGCVWAAAGSLDGAVLVDAWLFRPRDREEVRDGIARAGAELVAEIWCAVPVEVARTRYAGRTRHSVHDDRRDMTSEWRAWSSQAGPLGLAKVVRVDTSAPVDIEKLAVAVAADLGIHVLSS